MSPIGLDDAVARLDSLGLHRGYAVNIPTTPTVVFTGSAYLDDLSQQRVFHFEQYSGNVLIASQENMLNANRALTFQSISGNPLNFSNAARKL